MRWLIGITESVDMSLSKVHEIVNDSDAWHGAIHGVARSQTHCLTEKQCHFTPFRMAIIKKSTSNKRWRENEEKGAFLYCWFECKLV